MSVVGSVSQLIGDAQDGNEDALAKLHQKYWPLLVRIARSKLKGVRIPLADAEDVAQEAFISLHRNFKQHRVPDLANRHHLLAFLTHVIACLAVNEIKRSMAKKHGGGAIQNISPLAILTQDASHSPLQDALLRDCYAYYIDALPDNLRPFAELHLSGLTNREIATRLDCVERTVERKLALLRDRWQQMASNSLQQDLVDLLNM
jgi:RNA polymerase sigma factor (sigma-70 family)